jgi:hypothetical protein
MAKEKRNIKVKAKINLKYDKDVVKIGQEFLVRKSDIESIKDCVDVIGEVEDKKDDGANKGDGTNNDGEGKEDKE